MAPNFLYQVAGTAFRSWVVSARRVRGRSWGQDRRDRRDRRALPRDERRSRPVRRQQRHDAGHRHRVDGVRHRRAVSSTVTVGKDAVWSVPIVNDGNTPLTNVSASVRARQRLHAAGRQRSAHARLHGERGRRRVVRPSRCARGLDEPVPRVHAHDRASERGNRRWKHQRVRDERGRRGPCSARSRFRDAAARVSSRSPPPAFLSEHAGSAHRRQADEAARRPADEQTEACRDARSR